MRNFSLPLANPVHESEAQKYAANFKCDIESARRDVTDEYNATETETDAFYTRLEMVS